MQTKVLFACVLFVQCIICIAGLKPLWAQSSEAKLENYAKTLSISGNEQQPMPQGELWFKADAYDIKISAPAFWQNSIKMVDMRLPKGPFLKGSYGFMLDMRNDLVEIEQYMGVLVIYDRELWQTYEMQPNETVLLHDDEYVYVYVNNLVNPYPNLKQAALFDMLAIYDDEVTDLFKIEKTLSQ